MKKLLMFLTIPAISQTVYAQSVGINTASPHPSAMLHVNVGASTSQGLLVTGTFNASSSVPNLSAGTRLMFYPAKGAFRVGYVFSNQWDDVNVGLSSFAAGSSTIASGVSTTAMGVATKATAYNATAFGDNSTAMGEISTAFGQSTSAEGSRSTAMGYHTIARGFASTVLGLYNVPILAAPESNLTSNTPLFIVGNGDDDQDRSNALVVRRDGHVGIGSNTPAARLTVVETGIGTEAISATLSNPSTGARVISVQNSGVGAGVYASSAGGNALWGIASSISGAGVYGENMLGEAVVGRNKGGNGVGAVVGRNDSSGYGVRGFNTKAGIGVLGQAGISGGTGRGGVFENVNAANSSNALEARTNGTGAAAFFSNSGAGPALITGSGKVGIAVETPEYVLDVKGRIRLAGGGDLPNSAGLWLNNTDNTGQLGFWGVYDNNYFGWYGTGGASWNLLMNINNGYIGIGTQNPTQKLHVNGSICYTGSIAACSDIRYKKNIVPMQNVLSEVMSLHAIYYNWNKEKFTDRSFNDERQLGFSAQEIKKLFPEIVQTDAEGYMAVDYSRLTPVLVEAIKEQQSQITGQQLLIDQLHAQNKELISRMSRLEALMMANSR